MMINIKSSTCEVLVNLTNIKLFIDTIVFYMLNRNEWCLKPHQKICLWALMIAIKESVVMCQLAIRKFS